jgi:hypothetical protein
MPAHSQMGRRTDGWMDGSIELVNRLLDKIMASWIETEFKIYKFQFFGNRNSPK